MMIVAVPKGQWGLTIVLAVALAVGMLCSFIMLLPLFRFIIEAQNGENEWWKVVVLGMHQIGIAGLPMVGLCVPERKVRTRIACLLAWLIVVSPIAFILLRTLTAP